MGLKPDREKTAVLREALPSSHTSELCNFLGLFIYTFITIYTKLFNQNSFVESIIKKKMKNLFG